MREKETSEKETSEKEMREAIKSPRIFVAAGHGGPDSGAVSGALREADCNLAVALALREELERCGAQVRLSRERDEENRLRRQIDDCNAYAPDVAVAVHTNAGGGTGFEVYYQSRSPVYRQASLRLATLLNEQVSRDFGLPTRGVKEDTGLGWLREVRAPCVLAEGFFVDGPRAAWYASPEQLTALAHAYARAILRYCGLESRGDAEIAAERVISLAFDLHTATGARQANCPAVCIDGHNFVQLRQFCQLLGGAVDYDAASGHIAVRVMEP